MSKNYKKGAPIEDILSITFDEVKSFMTDSVGVSMVVVDKWFTGMVLLIAILPILVFSGVADKKIADFTPVDKIVQKTTAVYDRPTFGIYGKKSYRKQGNKIGAVRKGEAVKLLGYTTYSASFQVELADGTRGFVPFDALGDTLLSQKWEKDVMEKGDTLIFKGVTAEDKFNVRCKGKTVENLTVYNCFPAAALGIPLVCFGELSPVTVNWVKNHIKIGKTTKEDIDKEWFGYALTQKNEGGKTVVEYPLAVQNASEGKIYDKCTVTYVDGVVTAVDYSAPKDMGFIMKHLPFVDAIQGNFLCVKYRSEKITAASTLNSVEDVKGKKESSVKQWVKENVGDVSLPMWLQYIIGIAGGLLALFLFLLFIHCLLLALPTLVSYLGYFTWLPNGIYYILMFASLLFGAELIYVFAGGLNWFFAILFVAYVLWQLRQWSTWVTYNRCSSCGHMYTLETVGWRSGGKSYYDNVTYNVTKQGGKEISIKETGREHRVISTAYEHLECQNCGATGQITHTSDSKV